MDNQAQILSSGPSFFYFCKLTKWLSVHRYCPQGIDLCFENVGGKMLEAALDNMKTYGRIAICGMVSQYDKDETAGTSNLSKILTSRLTVQGFLQSDYLHLQPQFIEKMVTYLKERKIVYVEDLDEGLESAVGAFIKLLQGGNVGKQIVRVAIN